MFRSCFSTLMSCLRPDAVPLPRVADIRRARAAVNATDALHAGLDSMALSERLERPDAYRQLQRERRTALEALLAVPPTEETVRRAIDLIGAICEESTWSANELRQPFDDENRPEIDLCLRRDGGAARLDAARARRAAERGQLAHFRPDAR